MISKPKEEQGQGSSTPRSAVDDVRWIIVWRPWAFPSKLAAHQDLSTRPPLQSNP